MTALVLSPAEVRRLLPMGECIELVEQALRVLARGGAINPLRWGMRLPDGLGLLGMMPGYLDDPRALGIKVVSVFPGNHGTELDAHQGVVVLFETEHGRPIAILDASEVTAIRTAAASGVATRLLARADAGDLGLLGSGVQARTHLEAMAQVRDLRRARVFSPSRAKREAFAARAAGRYSFPVEAVDSARGAVEGADLVCTTTSAREPVLAGEWLAPGVHVNAAGSSVRTARELDTAAVARARLYVDCTESTLNEAGDFLIPVQEGALDETHIVAEIGQVLEGQRPGRGGPDEITLFESLGLGIEDVITAHHVHARARAEGVGTEVDLGGLRAGPADADPAG